MNDSEHHFPWQSFEKLFGIQKPPSTLTFDKSKTQIDDYINQEIKRSLQMNHPNESDEFKTKLIELRNEIILHIYNVDEHQLSRIKLKVNGSQVWIRTLLHNKSQALSLPAIVSPKLSTAKWKNRVLIITLVKQPRLPSHTINIQKT